MMPKERYSKLKEYLKSENPILLNVIDKYEELDTLAHKSGLLKLEETYTSNISWWPMISVLGTFSAGKSSYINNYIGQDIQESGNQAVDDKFTVMCYGQNDDVITLPGLSLDADPRFPFYNISEEVNKVDPGEGSRVNLYMQLKTLKSEKLKGKIIIDSPGFDADSQRDGILKITNHIVDISDLVLIFFDARHPEPGAMRDTLKHLVNMSMKHKDANKILYILNQIDTTAKEDNLEAVIGSWQRALAQEGLITGNFYSIYNESAASVIDDPVKEERLKLKSNEDLKRINERIGQVTIERAYRIIKSLDDFSIEVKEEKLPTLQKALQSWAKKVFWLDTILVALIVAALVFLQIEFDYLNGIVFSTINLAIIAGVSFVVFALINNKVRNFFANRDANAWMSKDECIANGIIHNTKWWRPLFQSSSTSWNKKIFNKLNELSSSAKLAVQKLNDQFVSPSGNKEEEKPKEVKEETQVK